MGLSFAEYVLASRDSVDALRDAYLADVTVGGTWGAEVEARHLAQRLGVRIVFWVRSSEDKFQAVHRYGTSGPELHLLNEGNHFEAFSVAPIAGNAFARTHVVTNSGGGDCLFLAFHQALRRNSDEPSNMALKVYRQLVAQSMRREGDLDLDGMLVVLLDEFEDWGFALGAGRQLQTAIARLHRQYILDTTQGVFGGGSIPPLGFKQKLDLGLGTRDFVPRGKLSRADRMLDRIGRLIATQKSVHVAVALDGNTLVMSSNDDTDSVRAALLKLINRYGKSLLTTHDDPLDGVDEELLRVKSDTPFRKTKKTRREVDIGKLKALETRVLFELTTGGTLEKLQKIRAALHAGLFVNGDKTPKQQFLEGLTGVYLIPHVPRTHSTGVVHGEMNVTDAIQERRVGKNFTDDVFIGGTLIDCFDCNKAHKSRNTKLLELKEKWRFYSGGTHGNSFPSWYLTPSMRDNIDEPTFKLERFPNKSQEGEFWEDEFYFVKVWYRQYYFRTKRGTRNTDQEFNPFTGYRNPFDEWSEDERRVRQVKKTYLTELFLREATKSKIIKAHSSFADDSESDDDDYELELSTSKKKSVERGKKLFCSYQTLSERELYDCFAERPSFSLSFQLPKLESPLLCSALQLYRGEPPPVEYSLLFAPFELFELLGNFNPRDAAPLFQHGLRIELPNQRVLPSASVLALRDVERSYALQVGAMGDVIERLGSIWALPSGGQDTLVGEGRENNGFNLGSIYALFTLVICMLGDFVVDSRAPLFEVWDAIYQASLRAYSEDRLSAVGLVLQIRILVYLAIALQLTRLGERSLQSVLDFVRQHAA